MTSESRLEMFDRRTETMDKEEFISLGMKLEPQITKEELAKLFDESMIGYPANKEANGDNDEGTRA